MKPALLAAVAALLLSTGSVLAAPNATTTVTPSYQPPVAAESSYYTYYSGYVFPDDGSPSGTEPMAKPIPQPSTGLFTRIYLYPPAEGADAGNGP